MQRQCRRLAKKKRIHSIQQEFTCLPDQHKIKSIIYNHLPSSNPAVSIRFPLWVFNYWAQVSQLHAYATPSRKHEIVTTQFFPKIIQLFQQSHSTYTAESLPSDGCYPWAVGQNLVGATASSTTIVSGVFNILDSHWVSMTVDVERHTISYGDSLVSDRKMKEVAMRAVEWWIGVHIMGDFVCVDLPITCQTDSVSCWVFAVNSIQHLVFPQEGLLLTHEVITECYQWFLGALSRHNELVGFFVLFCALPLMRTPSDHPMMDESQTPMRVYSPSKLCL